MKKGTEPMMPIQRINTYDCVGMSIRLKIASDAMCTLIGDHTREGSSKQYAKLALDMADCLIKLEEETRNE